MSGNNIGDQLEQQGFRRRNNGGQGGGQGGQRTPGREQQRRQSLDEQFQADELKLLEEEMRKWPITQSGTPLKGIRSKFLNLLNLTDIPRNHSLFKQWMNWIGWYFIGRPHEGSFHSDRDGTIWGPSPVQGITREFPYNEAQYDPENDLWVLPEDHELYPVFHGAGTDKSSSSRKSAKSDSGDKEAAG